MTTQLYELNYPSPVWDWMMGNFETDQERLMALQKLEIARAVIRDVQVLAPVMDSASDRWQKYWDAGGNFTDGDLEPLGITASQFGDCVNFLDSFSKFMNGQENQAQIWRVIMNKMRRLQV